MPHWEEMFDPSNIDAIDALAWPRLYSHFISWMVLSKELNFRRHDNIIMAPLALCPTPAEYGGPKATFEKNILVYFLIRPDGTLIHPDDFFFFVLRPLRPNKN